MKAIDKGILLRVFCAALLLAAALGIAGCGKAYSRDEFNKLVMHKTPAEVKSAVGEPAWINDGKPITWIYHDKTFDSTTKKEDDKVSITFGQDTASGQEKVVDIRFE